jgi:hypothetical protein
MTAIVLPVATSVPVLPALLARADHELSVHGEKTRTNAEAVVEAAVGERRVGRSLMGVGVKAAEPWAPT